MTDLSKFDQYRSHPWHGLAPGIGAPTADRLLPRSRRRLPKPTATHWTSACSADDITDIPQRFVERLQHYFSTYKMVPGRPSTMVIREVYGVVHTQQVVRAAMDDYTTRFGQSDRKDQ